ncbi:hypothetical protein BDZ89DRAFT_1033981 [Hymenopellis radicata]|nr:hypothetical protein BDZ89DRAFT_1033981 [Hymenopellis radicata]
MDFLQKQYNTLLSALWLRLGILLDLFYIIRGSLVPWLHDIAARPQLLLHPIGLREQFFMRVWKFMADGVDENSAESKRALLPARAYGTVLDIGAGSGHTAKYLDRTRVTAYIALEPNVLLHENIYINATRAGCGAEEPMKIMEALRGRQVDTIVSVLTLCGVPDLKNTLDGLLRDVLKPGGTFLFYEHVACDLSTDVKWWQAFWTPLWRFIVGCRLDQNPHHVLAELSVKWSERETWGKNGENVNLFWHQMGCFVKAPRKSRNHEH